MSGKWDLAGRPIDNGRYVIQKPLDAGGMGAIWVAQDVQMGTSVVVKFPHEAMMEEGFRERFQHEARTLIQLSHRHGSIVNILSVGEHEGMPFFVMQFLSGGSLKKRSDELRRQPPQSVNWRRNLRWLEEIADALDFVHRNNVVHRDVKPPNIIFDEAGRAYLADFGITKSLDKELRHTATDHVIGTASYMAHEALILKWEKGLEGRADQYSLAVTLYEALSGRLPFDGQNGPAVMLQQLQTPPKSIHLLCPHLPPRLTDVIRQSLDKEPRNRFESCTDFANAVLDTFQRTGPGPVAQQGPTPRSTPVIALDGSSAAAGSPAAASPAAAASQPAEEIYEAEVIEEDAPARPAMPPTSPPPTTPVAGSSVDTAPGPRAPGPPPVPRSDVTQPMPPGTPIGDSIKRKSAPPPPPKKPAGPGKAQPQQAGSQAARTQQPGQKKANPSGKSPFKGAPSGQAGQNPFTPGQTPPPANRAPVPHPGPQPVRTPAGGARARQISCPWCWTRFSGADLLWIADHPDLHGDMKLGEHEASRFLPEQYTADCRAIDVMGNVCHRTACPRCHLVLPREMIDYEPVFISVLGAPSSGKTCLMSAMTWQLRNNLTPHFRYSFADADPELNHVIIENEQMLFMNNSNQLVRLQKTDLQGDAYGYREVILDGQAVNFLRPYIFSLRPSSNHPNYQVAQTISYAMCLYDNAGEHFMPGADSSATRVTRHLASSDAMVFVFDPSQHPRFRDVCRDSKDPQFDPTFWQNSVRQETVLIEAMNRIRRYGNLSLHAKYDKPLIVLLNKYDAWAQQFSGKRLTDPWAQVRDDYPASLDVTRIEQKSRQMRNLLSSYCPEVVAAAEDLSSQVTYIPVSAFGRRVEGNQASNGVRTGRLSPMWAEVPLLYILGKIRRGVIPKI